MSPTTDDLDARLARIEILLGKLINIARKHPIGRMILKQIYTEDIHSGSGES